MSTHSRPHGSVLARLVAAVAVVASLTVVQQLSGLGGAGGAAPRSALAQTGNGCQLNAIRGDVQHVINIQFDNTHFFRDRPSVPSDLEQMPHLLNFMKSNGTLLTNHHTPLISHTATDILTSLTGVYGDRMGVPVANSFRYFNPDGSSNLGVSFAYWTAPLFDPTTSKASDQQYNMLTASGMNAPAPWVPFTRAGCNVGAVATANTVLENTGIDIPTVFGANSPQAAEVKATPDQAFADFVGIGIHCGNGNSACNSADGARPDLLPQEPYGFNGYMGLFGHKYTAPFISPGSPLNDLSGAQISDGKGHVGFPGFDGMSASVSLSYVAAMQEHGVPVTYAYISDAHDNHNGGGAYGPGEAGYVAALKRYDDAFAAFFARLAADGITPANTVFTFSSDEGDHFAGGAGSPAGCDGVNVPCTYVNKGEVNTNLSGLLATQQGITTPFKVHSDSAPTVYITGNPAPGAAVTRDFERATSMLTAVNPITGNTDTITQFLADPVEMKLLHMVTADPMRTPTFTLFANPDYFLFAGAPNCSQPCVTEPRDFAWNHGDVQPDITTTWLGLVGPGVLNLGIDDRTWSDHADIRPTVLALAGLQDDYGHQGVPIYPDLATTAVPLARGHRETLLRLRDMYKQINAPVGQLSLASLNASTLALETNSTGDYTYSRIEGKIAQLNSDRDIVANVMASMLEGVAFRGRPLNELAAQFLIDLGQALLNRAASLTVPGP